MNLYTYLIERHTEGTAKRYLRDIEAWLQWQPHPQKAGVKEVLIYLGEQRKQGKQASLNCTLAAIKKYYDWLQETDQRPIHPCRALRLKDKRSRSIQLQDLFTSEELQQLLTRKERYELLALRNRTVLSLLVYQGLTTGELASLQLNDLDLEKGTINVPASRMLNGRVLKLKQDQILLLYRYVNEVRKQLLKTTTKSLIITKLGTPEQGEGIHYLVSTFKGLFPERKLNPKTIRQSVIANLLKSGEDLRAVQLFAGHKYPSSTENYRQTNLEALKDQVLKYHPLK